MVRLAATPHKTWPVHTHRMPPGQPKTPLRRLSLGGRGVASLPGTAHVPQRPRRNPWTLRHKPTVSLGVTAAMVSRCGHDSGQIEPRVAHELAGHGAPHAGPAEWTPHRRPRLTPRGCAAPTPPSDAGQP